VGSNRLNILPPFQRFSVGPTFALSTLTGGRTMRWIEK